MKKMIFITITAINILALNTFAVDETSHHISRPVFPKTTIPFDHKSSEQGICQILGYETGVPGSIRAWPDDYNERGEGLLINEYGDIVRMTNNSPVVLGIVCINKTRKNKLNLKLSSLNYPKHPKSKLFFSTSSSESGVCRALGYKAGAVPRSGRTYRDFNGTQDSLVINESGHIEKFEHNHYYAGVTCVTYKD